MQIARTHNPLSLDSDLMVSLEPGDIMSPNQVISRLCLEFRRPVICTVNGQIWSRADWDCPVLVRGTIRFIEFPMGGGGGDNNRVIGSILVAVAALAVSMSPLGPFGGLAVSVAGSLLLGYFFPIKAAENGVADTIYSISGSNRLRIDEPYAERFGERKFYPDLAMTPRPRNIDNNQYLYLLLILGIGEFYVNGIYIDKTGTNEYQDIDWNIIPPGADPDISVNWASQEAGGQELSTDWLEFVVNPSGTVITSYEYDILFPSGLVEYDDGGGKRNAKVEIARGVRKIDDRGNAISSWVSLPNIEFWKAVKDPLRYTHQHNVPFDPGPGRYLFRIKRVNAKSTNSKVCDVITLTGLRGLGGKHPAVQGVTMLKLKIKATNSLNGEVASRINVIATRKLLPVTAEGFGASVLPSRSIVDAIAYIATSSNGGQQAHSRLVWDELYSNKVLFDNEKYYFDWGFTSRVSVMDAAGKAAACGMAVPYSPGGLFCLAVDRLQSSVDLKYSGSNSIEKDSLRISHAFKTPDYPTCVRVTYTDPDTWAAQSVDCYTTGGSVENPREIQLEGCTSRDHAYQVGIRMWKELFLTTTSVEFVTGLIGNLPSLFSWAYICDDTVDWGQVGLIVKIVDGEVWTSEPIDFDGEQSGWIIFHLGDGSVAGPYACLPTLQSHVLKATLPAGIKTMAESGSNATTYVFGPQTESTKIFRVMSITPKGRDSVSIMGQIVNQDAYDLTGTVPGIGGNPVDTTPLSSVTIIYGGLNDLNIPSFNVSWLGSVAVYRVEINTGSGYSVFLDNYTGFDASFTVSNGLSISVRVTPYVDGVLDALSQKTVEYVLSPAPTVTAEIDSGTKVISASWSEVVGAESYQLSLIYDGRYMGSSTTTILSKTLTPSDIISTGGPWPQVDIQVTAYFNDGKETLPGVDSVTIMEPLSVPTLNLAALVPDSHLTLSWSVVSDPNGAYWSTSVYYVIYEGTTATFDPETEGVKVYDGPSNTITLWPGLTAPYAHYYKIAAYSKVFGADPDYLSFSGSLEVKQD